MVEPEWQKAYVFRFHGGDKRDFEPRARRNTRSDGAPKPPWQAGKVFGSVGTRILREMSRLVPTAQPPTQVLHIK